MFVCNGDLLIVCTPLDFKLRREAFPSDGACRIATNARRLSVNVRCFKLWRVSDLQTPFETNDTFGSKHTSPFVTASRFLNARVRVCRVWSRFLLRAVFTALNDVYRGVQDSFEGDSLNETFLCNRYSSLCEQTTRFEPGRVFVSRLPRFVETGVICREQSVIIRNRQFITKDGCFQWPLFCLEWRSVESRLSFSDSHTDLHNPVYHCLLRLLFFNFPFHFSINSFRMPTYGFHSPPNLILFLCFKIRFNPPSHVVLNSIFHTSFPRTRRVLPRFYWLLLW